MIEIFKAEINESIKVKKLLSESIAQLSTLEELVKDSIITLKTGGKIIFCGNGGSFADSQHLAAEFVSKLRFDRAPLPAIALGTNSSNLTAIGNDYGFVNIFKRELIAVANANDLFIPISTSGDSNNIIEAIHAAKEIGMKIYGLTGITGGKMNSICKTINIPSGMTEKIQESHIMIGHILCSVIEENIFKSDE
jgi:D-sedoheptulose 7-phosphate isomerase